MSFSKCVVCTDPETIDNQIFMCSICAVGVHTLCYGFVSQRNRWTSAWKCSPCSVGFSNPVCELCLQKGGALKRTTCGKWVHVICGLFTVGVEFLCTTRMEPVEISKIPNENRNRTCVFCSKMHGMCCSCSHPECANWIHITCAQKKDCLKEVENEKNNKLAFFAYCDKHKPVESSRRISAIFVREKQRQFDEDHADNTIAEIIETGDDSFVSDATNACATSVDSNANRDIFASNASDPKNSSIISDATNASATSVDSDSFVRGATNPDNSSTIKDFSDESNVSAVKKDEPFPDMDSEASTRVTTSQGKF